jgi:hypothetical protein
VFDVISKVGDPLNSQHVAHSFPISLWNKFVTKTNLDVTTDVMCKTFTTGINLEHIGLADPPAPTFLSGTLMYRDGIGEHVGKPMDHLLYKTSLPTELVKCTACCRHNGEPF